MAERIVGGKLSTSAEFQRGLTGACGPVMLAMLESWGIQKYVPMLDVFDDMHKAGRCSANGVSTMSQLRAQAIADGFAVSSLAYANPLPQKSYTDFLMQQLPLRAVGVQVARGQNLVDSITGEGEDAVDLKFHFFDIFGHHDSGYSAHFDRILPSGWYCGDGASNVMNPVVNGSRTRVINSSRLVFYEESVLASARPVAALALYPKVPIPGGTIVSWKKLANGSYQDGKGHTCGGAMGKYLTDAAHGLSGVDALSSEFYKPDPKAPSRSMGVLPLANGLVVTAHQDAQGNWSEVRADEGSSLYLAEVNAPSSGGVEDTKSATARAAVRAWLGI
jgi:hypothetical protein